MRVKSYHLEGGLNDQDRVYSKPGVHNPRAGSGPRMCYIRPQSRLKNTSNFSWMTEILWMNLNLIEMLKISTYYNPKQLWWQQYQTTSNKKAS